jgi:hypothetical protein
VSIPCSAVYTAAATRSSARGAEPSATGEAAVDLGHELERRQRVPDQVRDHRQHRVARADPTSGATSIARAAAIGPAATARRYARTSSSSGRTPSPVERAAHAPHTAPPRAGSNTAPTPSTSAPHAAHASSTTAEPSSAHTASSKARSSAGAGPAASARHSATTQSSSPGSGGLGRRQLAHQLERVAGVAERDRIEREGAVIVDQLGLLEAVQLAAAAPPAERHRQHGEHLEAGGKRRRERRAPRATALTRPYSRVNSATIRSDSPTGVRRTITASVGASAPASLTRARRRASRRG